MRLFVGLKLDQSQQQALAAIQSDVQQRLHDCPLQWHEHHNLHITLQFIGEVTPPQCQRLIQQLPAMPLAEHLTFAPQHIDWFPTPTKPIVLAVHYQHSANTARLLAVIANAIAASDIPVKPEARPFRAHITLARNKKRIKSTAINLADMKPPALTFSHYHLFESCYQQGALHYKSLAQYKI